MTSLSNSVSDVISEINLNTRSGSRNFHNSSRSWMRKYDDLSNFAAGFTFNLIEIVQAIVVIVSERLINTSSSSIDCLIFFLLSVALRFGKLSKFSFNICTFSEIKFRMIIQFSTFLVRNPAIAVGL